MVCPDSVELTLGTYMLIPRSSPLHTSTRCTTYKRTQSHGYTNVIDSLYSPIYLFFFSLGLSRSTSRMQYSMYVKEAASPNVTALLDIPTIFLASLFFLCQFNDLCT
ncbi:hypothetical protein H4582DRAFT_1325086 [Lactarius indigo]|nr:hypothetical protein H4582DRAFT_1325086 [Lactarius indigo]